VKILRTWLEFPFTPHPPLLDHAKKLPYLLLSALSGTFELGVILFSLLLGFPLTLTLALGFSYQFGSVVKDNIRLPSALCYVLLILAAATLRVSSNSPWLLLVVTTLASVSLQTLRDQAVKEGISTTLKRVSRIFGFLIAPLLQSYFTLSMLMALIMLLGIPVLVKRVCSWRISIGKLPDLTRLGLIMVSHQMHYFSYCYLVPVLFFLMLPAQYIGVAFVLGWLSYTFTPLRQMRSNWAAVVTGHVVVAGALVTMFFSHTLGQLELGWIMSGLGGGTVVSLRHLGLDSGASEPSMDLWEGYGHLAGAALSVATVVITRAPKSPLLLAMGFASLTIILTLSTRIRAPVSQC
jgi:hypothetical protein